MAITGGGLTEAMNTLNTNNAGSVGRNVPRDCAALIDWRMERGSGTGTGTGNILVGNPEKRD